MTIKSKQQPSLLSFPEGMSTKDFLKELNTARSRADLEDWTGCPPMHLDKPIPEMKKRYFLKTSFNSDWTEVSKEKWISTERAAGFRPKLWSGDPKYMTTCATSGFCGGGVWGKIEYEKQV